MSIFWWYIISIYLNEIIPSSSFQSFEVFMKLYYMSILDFKNVSMVSLQNWAKSINVTCVVRSPRCCDARYIFNYPTFYECHFCITSNINLLSQLILSELHLPNILSARLRLRLLHYEVMLSTVTHGGPADIERLA